MINIHNGFCLYSPLDNVEVNGDNWETCFPQFDSSKKWISFLLKNFLHKKILTRKNVVKFVTLKTGHFKGKKLLIYTTDDNRFIRLVCWPNTNTVGDGNQHFVDRGYLSYRDQINELLLNLAWIWLMRQSSVTIVGNGSWWPVNDVTNELWIVSLPVETWSASFFSVCWSNQKKKQNRSASVFF